MKNLFTIALVCILMIGRAQDEKEVDLPIKTVTVFLSGAQITRSSMLEVKSSSQTFILRNLSPRINEQSIQVELPESVKILAVSYRVNHLAEMKKSEAIIQLEKERDRFQNLIEIQQNALAVYKDEELMLKENKHIGGQQQGVNVAELKTAVDYFRNRLTEIKNLQRQHQLSLTDYENQVQKIEAQLKELSNVKAKPTGEIVIKVSSKVASRAVLRVSYLVQDASWLPSYDVRAVNVQSPIRLTYKANIIQHSGEDWNNVNLTISSANPDASGSKPNLSMWSLGFNNQLMLRGLSSSLSGVVPGLSINNNEIRGRVVAAEDNQGLPGANVVIKGTSVGTVTDANGEFSLPLTSDARSLVVSFIGMKSEEVSLNGAGRVDVVLQADVTQLNEVVVTAYGVTGDSFGGARDYQYQPRIKKTIVATPVVRQTNVEYNLDEAYTIKNDGEVRTVDMIEYEIDALYQYYTVPKLDQDAFLIARLVNWDEYNLLEGEANLFFEGKYVGKSILDTRNTSDTLSLSLGRDKNVVVTREKVKDISKSSFLGSQRKVTFAYEISVRNKKMYPIDIRIEDQIPVPNTKEIVVEKMEDTHADHNEDTGLITWHRSVASGKTEKMALRYSVKFPRYSNIVLE